MILFVYVLRDFMKYVVGIVALTTFLFILFDIIEKSTNYFGRYQPETEHLVSYYLAQIPNLMLQSIPIASLLGSVITMVLLGRSNEVTAMRAIGMGPFRIGLPIAFGGALLCLVSVVLGELVLPITAKRVHFIKNVLIEKNREFKIEGHDRWQRQGQMLVKFRLSLEKDKLEDVRVIYTGQSFRPKRTIEAREAQLLGKDEWMLSDLKILYFWPNGTLSYTEERKQYRIGLNIDPSRFQKELRTPTEMASRELKQRIVEGESTGSDILGMKVDLHVKIAFHFASFVVCLIGLKFGYRSERSIETARGILLALSIGVAYWFILRSGAALGKRGNLPPVLAAWMANVIIFGISFYSLLKMRKA